MKIMFVWRKIDQVAGGVERMITEIMNEMVRRGHDVSLLTWDRKNATAYYEMDKAIKWHCLNMGDPMERASLTLRLKRAPRVRKIVKQEKPDVIMCFESGVFFSTRLFLLGLKIPMIAAERNAPSRLNFSTVKAKNKVHRSLRPADKITVQFERYREGYPPYLRDKIVCIHNPVLPVDGRASPAGAEDSVKKLLCVARLAYQKNTDVLIHAFASIANQFPDWILQIAGDGDDEEKIKNMVRDLGIQERVELLGKVQDVKTLYENAHLFCLPSRWEGFPNALAEAMAYGLPAVGFSKCSGVSDLIQDGITGLLAQGQDNAATLAHQIAELMDDGGLRQTMGESAIKAVEQYRPEAIFDQWEELFISMNG